MTSFAASHRNAGRRRRESYKTVRATARKSAGAFPTTFRLGKENANLVVIIGEFKMAKPGRVVKKANHGKRPANAKARRAKRRIVKT